MEKGKPLKLVDAVRKGLEATTKFTLNDQAEDYGENWLHIYRLREKKPCSFYIPIEFLFNTIRKTISLRFEENYGLIEAGGDNSIKGIAKWFRKYADFMEARHRQIRELGYRLEQKHIDGIHHIYFYYQKDFTHNQVEEVVKELKKLLEIVIVVIIW